MVYHLYYKDRKIRWKFSQICIYFVRLMSQNHGGNSHCYFIVILKNSCSEKIFFLNVTWTRLLLLNYYLSLHDIYFFLTPISCLSIINFMEVIDCRKNIRAFIVYRIKSVNCPTVLASKQMLGKET